MSSEHATKSSNQNLISKIFRRGSTKADASDAASTMSGETLVQKEPMKSTSQEEHDIYADLMMKANTMNEEEFKKYLKDHKEVAEAAYRKQGGGLASGEWIVSGVPIGSTGESLSKKD